MSQNEFRHKWSCITVLVVTIWAFEFAHFVTAEVAYFIRMFTKNKNSNHYSQITFAINENIGILVQWFLVPLHMKNGVVVFIRSKVVNP